MALILVAASPALSLAQSFHCYADSGSASLPRVDPRNIGDQVVVRVYTHIIEGTSALRFTQAEVDATIEVMREDFAPFGIRFEVNTSFGLDSTYDTGDLGLPPGQTLDIFATPNESVVALRSFDNGFYPGPETWKTDGIHIAFGSKTSTRGCSGFTYDAGGAATKTKPDQGTASASLHGEDTIGEHILSHEIGHLFGLLHTFEADGISDTDEAPDMRPEASCCGEPGEQGGGSLVNDNCEFVFTPEQQACTSDDLTQYTNPDPTNIMAYTRLSCMAGFTAGQGDRMRDRLRTDSDLIPRSWPYFQVAERSTDTGFNYSGDPYASISLDYDNDGDLDLLLTSASGPAGLMENGTNLTHPDVPLLQDTANSAFPPLDVPSNNRGVATADYDNDGYVDIFMAGRTSGGNTPRVYRGSHSGSLTETTSTVLPGFTSVANDSWAGAWGDYDRDGYVDLYIGRATGTDADPTGAAADVLLRNRGDGTFEDRTLATGLVSAPAVATTGASWADATGDGELDLFVGAALLSEASQLIVQSVTTTGSYEYEHSFAVENSLLPSSPSTLDEIRAVSWRDLNGDGELDLLLGGSANGENGTRVLWSDGAGTLNTTTAIDGGFAAHGQSMLDLDLDGRADILLAPSSAALAPGIFRNQGGTSPTFNDPFGDTAMATTTASSFRALLTADLAGPSNAPDGDEDIYIGRLESSDAYFYQTKLGDEDLPGQKWLKVTLASDNRPTNDRGIGAVVTVTTTLPGGGTLEQSQLVDGGSGAGAQQAPELTFGLDDTETDAFISVAWPDGYVQTRTVDADSLNASVTIQNDHGVGLDGSSVSAYVLSDGQSNFDWVFEWETDYLTVKSLDRVVINGGKSPCPTYSSFTLTPASSGVTHQVFAKTGGGYLHRLVWEGQGCLIGCKYTYTASSAVSTSAGDRVTSGTKTFNINFCIN